MVALRSDWKYATRDGIGFFLVLNSLPCNYRRCRGCSVWRLNQNGALPTSREVEGQIASTAEELELEPSCVREISVSNCGSIFDDTTIPFEVIENLCAQAKNKFPGLKRIIFESRPNYATQDKLVRLSAICVPLSLTFYVCVGLEIWNQEIRYFYRKGVSNLDVANLKKRLDRLPNAKLYVYLMYKPLPLAYMADHNKDILDAVAALKGEVIIHINPTYVAQNTWLETKFKEGSYAPPTLKDLVGLISQYPSLLSEVRIGLSDEGLAADDGSFRKEGDQEYYEWLCGFNKGTNLAHQPPGYGLDRLEGPETD